MSQSIWFNVFLKNSENTTNTVILLILTKSEWSRPNSTKFDRYWPTSTDPDQIQFDGYQCVMDFAQVRNQLQKNGVIKFILQSGLLTNTHFIKMIDKWRCSSIPYSYFAHNITFNCFMSIEHWNYGSKTAHLQNMEAFLSSTMSFQGLNLRFFLVLAAHILPLLLA